jgi:hypothetical protein
VARLRRTDQWFSGKRWELGEYIKELDWTTTPDPGCDAVVSDTFVWASIQMLAERPSVKIIEQYHADQIDFVHRQRGTNLWDGLAGWVHYGSVSSGYYQLLQDKRGVPISYRAFPNWEEYRLDLSSMGINHERAFEEYQRRVSWWSLCYDTQKDKLNHIPGLNEDYHHAVESFMTKFGFDRGVVESRKTMYRQLLGI